MGQGIQESFFMGTGCQHLWGGTLKYQGQLNSYRISYVVQKSFIILFALFG